MVNFIKKIMEENGDLNKKCYVESFCGAANLLLNLPDNFIERYSFDLSEEVVNMWRELQINGSLIRKELISIDYTEENFLKYKDEKTAIGTIIKHRFSRGALGKNFAFSERLRNGLPGDVNAYRNWVYNILPLIIEKIKGVVWDVGSADTMLIKYGLMDRQNILLYDDPPYVPSTRSAPNVYDYEMDTYGLNTGKLTHEGLLNNILLRKSVSYLSGYSNPLYDDILKGYNKYERNIANHSSQSKIKARRCEVVWEIKPR